MLREAVVKGKPRAPSAPILQIRRLRIDHEELVGLVVPVGGGFPIGIEKHGKRGALRFFVNSAIDFVAQPVGDGQLRHRFPGVLKVKVVSFAAHAGFVELATNGREGSRDTDVVRVRCGGEQTGERIGKRIANCDVVRSARGRNVNRRIRGAAAKGIPAVRTRAEDGGIPIEADLGPPLISVVVMHITHIVLELVEIGVRAEDRSSRRVKAFKEPVAEAKRRLRVIGGGEKRGTADVSQRSFGSQVRTDGPCVLHTRAPLMVEELDAETGIDRGLIGIRDRARNLIQTEAAEELGLAGNAVVDTNGKLIGARCHLR